MNKLILKKSGFKFYCWDGESKVKHNFIKLDNDKVKLVNKETDEEIGVFNSFDDAESIFWIEKDKSHIVSQLRYGIEIDEDVTVEDFISSIRKNYQLNLFCNVFFGSP